MFNLQVIENQIRQETEVEFIETESSFDQYDQWEQDFINFGDGVYAATITVRNDRTTAVVQNIATRENTYLTCEDKYWFENYEVVRDKVLEYFN